MHIIQWIMYRRYLPSIVTSVLVLPYCVYTFNEFVKRSLLTPSEMVGWSLAGLVMLVVNFLLVHKLAERFDRWNNKVQTN